MSMFRVRHWYDLLDRSGARLGMLRGVREGSGSVARSAAASVKASASLTVTDTGQVQDWTQVRIRPVIEVNGDEWPLGVFLPDFPEAGYTDGQRTMDVKLLDKTTILDGDAFGVTYGVQSGTNVVSAVRQIIETTGEPAVGLEDAGVTLRSSVEAEPDDSKLLVVNQLLDAGGFFSLYTGGGGGFHADPYITPQRRPVTVEFVDGDNASLYLPEFTRTQDLGSVPNHVRAVSQADEDEEALVADARNTNRDSPFSFDRLGYWRTHIEQDVKTTSQSALQAYAGRRLQDLMSPQETIVIEHPPYQLTINDAVTFTSRQHGLDGLYTVQNQDWDLRFDGMVTSKLRRVVDA